jgi:hypothetical protein
MTCLLLLIVLLVFRQPTAQRFYAACCFVVPTVLHDFIFAKYDGLLYYGSAALTDSISVALLSIIGSCKLAYNLQRLCLVSILLNFVGWITWTSFWSPTIYNLSFLALYTTAALLMLRKEKADGVGDSTLVRRYSNVQRDYSSCRADNHQARG